MNPNQPQQHQHQQQQQQQQIMRVPKQEVSVGARRYVQQAPPNRQSQRQQQQQQNGSSKNGKTVSSSSVAIEDVTNNSYDLSQTPPNQLKVDDDKLPVFLIKLWNIVEDSNLQSIVHWDESGASFHISDPYSFCRNVLPHFFKHNNLNSLIRQLNMYGFRKMTPLSQGGLTRTESDQDHLEFSHPCFVQGRPELLSQIKRKVRDDKKQSAKVAEDKQVNEQTQQNLEVVMSEMRAMREKAKNMEDKMNKLTKENRDMWNQMGAMRQQHARQQQYFKKLLHFLVSVMQPGLSKRVAKRGVLEIDFGANNLQNGAGGPNTKRTRMNSDEGPYKDVCDLLESLQRESQEPFSRRFSNNEHGGPLISEVTDEFGNSPAGSRNSDMFPDNFGGNDRGGVPSSRYSDTTNSREQSPHPIISQPSSSQNAVIGNNGGYQDQKPEDMYLGSGPLTHENIHRGAGNGIGGKRDYQGVQMNSSNGNGMTSGVGGPTTSSNGKVGQKRAPYKQATRQMAQNQPPQEYQGGPSNYNFMSNNLPAQLTYQPTQPQQPCHPQKLMAIEDQQPTDPHQNLYSPTLGLSPSFDRQLSQELQEYFTGFDSGLDGLRELVNHHNWDNFGDNLPLDDDEEPLHHEMDQHEGGGVGGVGQQQGTSQHQQQQQQYRLALKNAPESSFYDDAGELLDPLLNDSEYPETGFQVPFIPGSELHSTSGRGDLPPFTSSSNTEPFGSEFGLDYFK